MKSRFVYPVLAMMALASFAAAALPPLSPEELYEKAAVVMTGRVVGSRILTVRKPGSAVLLVRLLTEVESTEKGDSLMTGSRHLEIRCRKIVESEMTGPVGHQSIPAEGARFRMWLVQNAESQWEPLEPNGIELLDGSAEMDFTGMTRARSMRDFTIAGVVGIATLIALGVFFFRRRRSR